jgi:hypothetical protein
MDQKDAPTIGTEAAACPLVPLNPKDDTAALRPVALRQSKSSVGIAAAKLVRSMLWFSLGGSRNWWF